MATIRLCPKCQTETVRHADGKCKPCSKTRDAARYAANAEKSIASATAWRHANPERAKATSAAWAKANRDRRNLARVARFATSPDKREKRKVAHSALQKANLEACRISKQNRKAKQRENGGTLSKGLSAKLFTLQRGKCACCSLPLGTNFHLDHIVPIVLGGPNADSNIQLLRQRCNIQKKAKHPVDFMQSRGFLL
jgi:5-methylcytosine-specific restriction endonuclease McrA